MEVLILVRSFWDAWRTGDSFFQRMVNATAEDLAPDRLAAADYVADVLKYASVETEPGEGQEEWRKVVKITERARGEIVGILKYGCEGWRDRKKHTEKGTEET